MVSLRVEGLQDTGRKQKALGGLEGGVGGYDNVAQRKEGSES